MSSMSSLMESDAPDASIAPASPLSRLQLFIYIPRESVGPYACDAPGLRLALGVAR